MTSALNQSSVGELIDKETNDESNYTRDDSSVTDSEEDTTPTVLQPWPEHDKRFQTIISTLIPKVHSPGGSDGFILDIQGCGKKPHHYGYHPSLSKFQPLAEEAKVCCQLKHPKDKTQIESFELSGHALAFKEEAVKTKRAQLAAHSLAKVVLLPPGSQKPKPSPELKSIADGQASLSAPLSSPEIKAQAQAKENWWDLFINYPDSPEPAKPEPEKNMGFPPAHDTMNAYEHGNEPLYSATTTTSKSVSRTPTALNRQVSPRLWTGCSDCTGASSVIQPSPEWMRWYGIPSAHTPGLVAGNKRTFEMHDQVLSPSKRLCRIFP